MALQFHFFGKNTKVHAKIGIVLKPADEATMSTRGMMLMLQ
jgi:hypothetical protein